LGFFEVYPFRYSFVADHFQYLACIGPIVLTSVGIDVLFRSYGKGKLLWEKVFCAALMAVLGGLTWQQSKMYTDPETLWQTTITRNSDSYLACCNLGGILLQTGRLNAAIEQYRRALQIRPRDALAENDLGIVLLKSGQVDEAIIQFNRTLQIDPGYFAAYNNLGDAFARKGEVEHAIAAYKKAVEIQPNNATVQNNLGYACLRAGRVDEAIVHDREALRVQPNNPDFHYNLANALVQRGQVQEAKEQFQATLKIVPDSPAALNNLAWLLATCPEANIRNGAQAVTLAEQANRLSQGADPAILDTLAAAYAEEGRYLEAVTVARQALQLARAQNQTSMADAIQLQINLYQAGSPFREIIQSNNVRQPERP
jgi:Flp pilus assembly protein TadD